MSFSISQGQCGAPRPPEQQPSFDAEPLIWMMSAAENAEAAVVTCGEVDELPAENTPAPLVESVVEVGR